MKTLAQATTDNQTICNAAMTKFTVEEIGTDKTKYARNTIQYWIAVVYNQGWGSSLTPAEVVALAAHRAQLRGIEFGKVCNWVIAMAKSITIASAYEDDRAMGILDPNHLYWCAPNMMCWGERSRWLVATSEDDLRAFIDSMLVELYAEEN